MSNVLRNIPSVNELLERPPLRKLVERVNRNVVVSGVRDFLESLRKDVQTATSDIPTAGELAERIAEWISQAEQPRLRPVINATGILLHTGLGRAPLAEAAIAEIQMVARGYASVEVDLEEGERSQRTEAVERILRRLTGGEAAAVVNNNAAATLLALTALAAGREVIVSRGQLIEIGGSYRLPDVMQAGGVLLREVGTTNKTRIGDYEAAIGEATAALMRVHTSNYVVHGFTEQARLDELVQLGRQYQLPVLDDIGSGALYDFSVFGVTGEPQIRTSLQAGADLVLFSGDKLLGGPQCGILVGRRKLIQAVTRHPLARAMRVDKLTLAALVATLRLYDEPETVEDHVPLLALLATPLDNLRHRAERLAPQLTAAEDIENVEVIEDVAYVGGGSVPSQGIPTICLALTAKPQDSVEQLAARLRKGSPSVVGRVQQSRLLLDLRTVFPHQDMHIVACCVK